MTSRHAFALVLLLAVSACGGESEDVPDGKDWIVEADADTTGSAALFAHFADGTVERAFERLAEQPFSVTVTLTDLDPDDAAGRPEPSDTLGVFRQTLEVTPGAAARVVRTTASGTLADSAGLEPSRLFPANPLPALLPGDAPFLDPSTRGAYRLDIEPMAIGHQYTLRVADPSADRPLVRSATAQKLMSDRLSLAVQRASRSAIYDETSSASVLLQSQDGGARLPVAIGTSFQTATPGRRRRLTTRWTIQPLMPSVQDSTMNRREP